MIGPKIERLTIADERRAYALVTRRDEEACVKCGRSGVVHRDHRQNRMPGNTVPSNLQLLCPPDHEWKTQNPKAAIAEGYAVPRHTIHLPSFWPARRRIRTQFGTFRDAWVLYFDKPEHGRLFVEISEAEARDRMARGMF